MIQYSGWTIIREAYSESGEDEKLLDDIIKRIKARIGELEAHNEFYDLRPLNGEYPARFICDRYRQCFWTFSANKKK